MWSLAKRTHPTRPPNSCKVFQSLPPRPANSCQLSRKQVHHRREKGNFVVTLFHLCLVLPPATCVASLPPATCVADMCGHRRPQEATGGHRRPQDTGGHRRPQEATGGHRRPQEATGGHKRPQEATGGHRRPQEATKIENRNAISGRGAPTLKW